MWEQLQLMIGPRDVGTTPIDDRPPKCGNNSDLSVVIVPRDWYAGIVEFLTIQQLPDNWTREERRKVRVNSRHFAVVDNRLFKRGLMAS